MLLVADTMGESRMIVQFRSFPQKFEWVSDTELLVGLIKDSAGRRCQLISCVNLGSGTVDTMERIERALRGSTTGDNTEEIDGPRLTAAGRVYYTKTTGGKSRVVVPRSNSKSHIATALSDDRILRWDFRSDGLYEIKVNLSDSIKLMDRPQPKGVWMLPPVMNANGTVIAYYNEIRSLSDAWSLSLPTLLDSLPAGADACGFSDPSFDPVNDAESIWELSCDDGHRIIAQHVVLINIRNNAIIFLDDLTGLQGCQAPRYSPDGSKLSLITSGRVYIICRGN
jgi:hypothetical protein